MFGRGNQQRRAGRHPRDPRGGGRDAIVVVATPAKLAALGGRPLLVDTGDAGLDAELAGYLPVITGRRDRTVYR